MCSMEAPPEIYIMNTAEAGNVTSSVVNPKRFRENGLFQVDISAAATVLLQGTLDTVLPLTWTTIKTYTASGADRVTLFPNMRTTISGNTGAVNSALME